jgi:drug/metabolite transporter (DMT)-like permease
VEFSGVMLLSWMNSIFSLNSGLLWLLLAALSLGIYNLLQRKLTKTYSGLQTATYSIFAGTFMLTIFLPAAVSEIGAAPPVLLLYIAILGIFSSAFAYVTWAQALKKAERTSSVSNYMFITPFLTTLLGFVFAGEKPDGSTIAGSLVILTGVLIFNFGDRLAGKVFGKKSAV